MKIGIIGLGFVGLSLTSFLGSKGHKIIAIDSDESKLKKISNGKIPFYEQGLEKLLKKSLKHNISFSLDVNDAVNNCKIIFVTVGTPQKKNGEIDLTMIKSVFQQIGKNLKNVRNDPVIVIKSTIIPETTQKMIRVLEQKSKKKNGKDFGVINNPEFLQETQAVRDTQKPHIIVIGGKKDKFFSRLKNLYKKLHPKTPIIETNSQTSELIKYANNSFLATKISFINQIASICESIPNANVDDVARSIGLDPRIGNLFLNAGPGYGGSCLPKDIKAIINFSTELGLNPLLLHAVEHINQNQVKKVVKTIYKLIGGLKNRRITVLGLAFKPETDDIRDSISIKLIRLLLKKGSKIIVHDPEALKNTESIFGKKIEYANTIKDALKQSECGVIVTPWKQYSKISNNILKQMKTSVILDTRRVLKNPPKNLRYYAFGVGIKE